MTTYTIRNSFHNTEARVRTMTGELSPSQIRRVRNTLCGAAGCTCGGNLGERGPQECDIDVAGYRGNDLVIRISDKARD